jgi:hypothetical protein
MSGGGPISRRLEALEARLGVASQEVDDDEERDELSPERRAAFRVALLDLRGRALGRPLTAEEVAEWDACVAAQPRVRLSEKSRDRLRLMVDEERVRRGAPAHWPWSAAPPPSSSPAGVD